jgi:hypothetical protein
MPLRLSAARRALVLPAVLGVAGVFAACTAPAASTAPSPTDAMMEHSAAPTDAMMEASPSP